MNPDVAGVIESEGSSSETPLYFIGKNEQGNRMQVAELRNHPFFVGMQAHPELASRPLNPSPPFLGLVAAAAGVLPGQLQYQLQTFKPPHPQSAMVLESQATESIDTKAAA